MTRCVFQASCFFFNCGISEMPSTTECLKEKYCEGRYTECARYNALQAYGTRRVPRSLCPNDLFETQKVT